MHSPMVRSLSTFALPVLCFALLGCGPRAQEPAAEAVEKPAQTSHLARIKEQGTLTMLSVPHQESTFVKTHLETGPMRRVGTAEHFEGVDVDVMSAFAKHLGVELAIRPAIGEGGLPAYAALIPALLHGGGDVIASSFSITDERREKIDFSDPYFSVYPAVVVRIDRGIETIADLAGKKASTVPGTSQERILKAAGFSPEELVYVEFQFENYTAVLDGEVDFTVQDSSSAERFVLQYPELQIVGPLMDVRESYGYGVPPGSDLLGELNAFLGQLQESGTLEGFLAERHLSLVD